MYRKKRLIILFVSLLALVGCEGTSGNSELQQMRTDLERLENEIGRLEFRLYELENPGNGSREAIETPATPAAEDTARNDMADSLPTGKVDIRPVD